MIPKKNKVIMVTWVEEIVWIWAAVSKKIATTIGFGGDRKDVASGDADSKCAIGGSTNDQVGYGEFIEHGYGTSAIASCQLIVNTLFHNV